MKVSDNKSKSVKDAFCAALQKELGKDGMKKVRAAQRELDRREKNAAAEELLHKTFYDIAMLVAPKLTFFDQSGQPVGGGVDLAEGQMRFVPAGLVTEKPADGSAPAEDAPRYVTQIAPAFEIGVDGKAFVAGFQDQKPVRYDFDGDDTQQAAAQVMGALAHWLNVTRPDILPVVLAEAGREERKKPAIGFGINKPKA